MQLKALPTLTVVPETPKEVKSRVTKLGKRADDLNRAAAELQSDIAAYRDVDHSSQPMDGLALADQQVEVLRAARQWRIDAAKVLDEYRSQVMPSLITQAVADHESAQHEVRELLVGIGYHDVPASVVDPSKIQPGWVMAHPRVLAAQGRLRELQDKQHDAALTRANAAAIDELTEQIRHAKSKMANTSLVA